MRGRAFTGTFTVTDTTTGSTVTVTKPETDVIQLPGVAGRTYRITTTSQTPTPTGVVVYVDTNYTGASATLATGTYTSAQLQALGINPGTISSLRVPSGTTVVGFSADNFTGTSWTFTADNANLSTTGNNDAIVSLRVGTVTPTPQGYARISNVTTGLAVDSGGNVASGSNIKQWTWDGSNNLQWQLVDLGGGWYRIVNRTNGMVIDSWGNTANGAPARQTTWNGGNNQQWRLNDVGSGRYRITEQVDRPGPRQRRKRRLRVEPRAQWAWDGSVNLQWTVVFS